MRSPLFFKLFFPVYNVPFSLVSFNISPYLWFSSVWLWFCLYFLFFFFGTYLFWGFLNFPNCMFMSFIGFEKYISFYYFFWYLLLLQSFSFFSWNSNYPYVSLFKIVLQVVNVCFFILSFFFLSFSQIALFPLSYLQVHWISLCVFPLNLGHVFLAFHQHIRLYLDILRVILKRFWNFFFFLHCCEECWDVLC